MIARVAGAIGFLLLSLAVQAAQTLDLGTYNALVIGNNDYKQLTKLEMAQKDAVAVARLLRKSYGFETELILNATRSDIIDALAALRATLTENDNLLIYYAGHGLLDQDSGVGYWLPVNAERDNPVHWISNDDITSQLKAMRARHVMVIADSCYAGTLTRKAEAGLKTGAEQSLWLSNLAKRRSRTALISGGLEPVLDAGGGDHSVFARALLDALGDNTEVLSGQTLFDRLKGQVLANADQTPEYETIREAGDEGGDFLFKPVGATLPGSSAAPAPGPNTGAKDRSTMELAFWDAIEDSTDPAEFEEFLRKFPNGTFAGLARLRIKQLRAKRPSPAPDPEAERKQKTDLALLPPAPPEPPAGVAPKGPKPGDVFNDCDLCPKMVVVPPGEFIMGSPAGEKGRDGDEGPRHRVVFSKAFAIGKYEVTRGEYLAFARETGHPGAAGGCDGQITTAEGRTSRKSWRNPGFTQTDRDPVVCIAWGDAQAYVKWLSRKTGHEYRLPSEAEWEYAARAGTETARYWGEKIGSNRTNCNGCGSGWDHKRPAPVGSFNANPFGLHDMLGNNREWVEDCYQRRYQGASSGGGARTGGDCAKRVMRGGSWESKPKRVRAANRNRHDVDDLDDDFGFRVVRIVAE